MGQALLAVHFVDISRSENRLRHSRLYNSRRIAREKRTTMNPTSLVGALRRLASRPEAGNSSDTHLLDRFVNHRDESAFELLVWRHGPMVLGVCRRIVRDEHEAEDAFQATLLALARRAGSIGKRDSVGSWLYKIAYRVALRARQAALRRARRERHVDELPSHADPHSSESAPWEELRPVLDEELSRLAEKHRAPVVLCYLEGLTNEEAARQLRCPVGTIKTRLAHARRLLSDKLSRRGLTLAGGLLTSEVVVAAASSAPSPALVVETVRIAALAAMGKIAMAGAASAPVVALAEGVLRAMMMTKLKQVVVVLMVGLAFAGAGTISYRACGDEESAAQRKGSEAQPSRKATPAEVRIKEIKKQISELTQQLQQAEEVAARERAVPPRKTPVAVIFGQVAITRDELADYLFSRMTTKQLDAYINRRILEHACKEAGISVTRAEVDAQLEETLKKMNMTEQTFRAQVLKQQNKTMQEWKEDVIRTNLMLTRLSGSKAPVTEKALRSEFEARYGDKVECEIMIWQTEERSVAQRLADLVRAGKLDFATVAARQRQMKGGPLFGAPTRPIVIGRTGSKAREALEKAAFALEPGEFSQLIEHPTGFVLLKCARRIPADRSVRFDDVRASLERDLLQQYRDQGSAKLFAELRARAGARLLWTPPPENLERGDK
jgi:RNA polymerase sigma factor (sigma-70 family)